MSNFPLIKHIDDVLPHIEGRTDVRPVVKDGYTFVNYVSAFSDPTLFDHPMRRECRGLKFAPNGKLLARPFHKFFNYGERGTELPVNIDHLVYEKLDGSMVHPCIVNGSLVFMTRGGISEVAEQAYRFAGQNIRKLCLDWMDDGFTPIFEWCSPLNRIIIHYETSKLVLTAIRHNYGGWYLSDEQLLAEGKKYGVPVVNAWGRIGDLREFVKRTRDMRNREGAVVRYTSGHMVKVKADKYALHHKAKDGLFREKFALAVVLDGGVDDLIPLLTKEDAASLEKYAAELSIVISKKTEEVKKAVDDFYGSVSSYLSIKEKKKLFVSDYLKQFDPQFRFLALAVERGDDPRAAVIKQMQWFSRSGKMIEENRHLFGGLDWKDYFSAYFPLAS